jgi:predicted aminopeptidase
VNRAAAVAVALLASGCWTSRYLAEQGAGQLRLLRARRRITEVLADPTTPAQTKERLQLAKAARDFGVEVLGLRGGDAFTRFLDLDGKPVAWNVVAAEKDRLQPRLRAFPIAGRVPYVGYFREASARAEAARLAAEGLDVVVLEVAGYSSVGVLSDPIYSSMLDGPPARIVEVVLHEMLHGTIYLPGHSAWNESLATFVGLEGARGFFARQEAGAGAIDELVRAAAQRERDQARFAALVAPFLAELEALYHGPLPRAEKLRRREPIFARLQDAFRREFPPKPGRALPLLLRGPINNALLSTIATYNRATPEHRRLYAQVGWDLRRFVALYRYAVESTDDPIAWLKRR